MSNARNLARLLPNASGQLPDAAMAAGSVLQVVSTSYASQFSTTSVSLVDTPLTATITPSSSTSKILVIISAQGSTQVAGTTCCMGVAVKRNGTTIMSVMNAAMYGTGFTRCTVGNSFLDSPATTSAVTYTLQIKSAAGGTNVSINQDSGSDTSTFTLMEIAA